MAKHFGKQETIELLEARGISFERLEHEAAFTMEEMDEAGITSRGTVCKNLFLRDFKGREHFLVTVPENKHVDMRKLAERLNSSKLSFASAERLMKYLGVTQGSVSPLGVLNDESRSVKVVFDKDLQGDMAVGVHPNENTATLWLSFEDLCGVIKNSCAEIITAEFERMSQ